MDRVQCTIFGICFLLMAGAGITQNRPSAKSQQAQGDPRHANQAPPHLLRTLPERNHTINSVAFSPNGKRIVTGCEDGTAIVWDTTSVFPRLKLHVSDFPLYFASFSPDGKRFVTGGQDCTIRVWDADTGHELMHTTDEKKRYGFVYSYWVAYSFSGEQILMASQDAPIQLVDAETGALIRTLPGPRKDFMDLFAYSSDSEIAIGVTRSGIAILWNTLAGEETHTFYAGYNLRCIALSADGELIALGRSMNGIDVMDIPHRKTLTLKEANCDRSMAFSRDGAYLATGERNRSITIWDTKTGKLRLRLEGHTTYPVCALAFSPDGHLLASGSYDGTTRIWDVSSIH